MTTFVSHKCGKYGGTAILPGDKSISIRVLILAALSGGTSRIEGLPASDDIVSTIRVLRGLGVKIKSSGGTAIVKGVGGKGFKTPDRPLDFGNSGTASRLMMGVLAGRNIRATFTGDASLKKRPFDRVMGPLSEMGVIFDGTRLPFGLAGTPSARVIDFTLPVASAQVKSAVLLAGLNARGTTRVVEQDLTRDHTERMFGAFGVDIGIEVGNFGRAITVKGGQIPKPVDYRVPGDVSSAAFPLAAAMIAGPGPVTLKGVGVNPTRTGILRVLKKMGAKISLNNHQNDSGEPVADIHLVPGPLSGVTTGPGDAPFLIDEFPILFVAAAFARGKSKFSGLSELRKKESDRLTVMARGLAANGVRVKLGQDSLTIHGGPVPGGATIDACHDHRIAMSFLVLGFASEKPVTVSGAETISTSFPGFASVMNDLGAKIGRGHDNRH